MSLFTFSAVIFCVPEIIIASVPLSTINFTCEAEIGLSGSSFVICRQRLQGFSSRAALRMPTSPAENRKRKEKEMLLGMQKAYRAYSACSAMLPSTVFSRSRGSSSYIKIALRRLPVEIAVKRKDEASFQERRDMRCFSSGNRGRLKYASMLP